MISALDRERAVELIEQAHRGGARLAPACQELGISVRTYQRWTRSGEVAGDGRPEAVRAVPANKLSAAERERILEFCHKGEFASLPPSQIVPALADRGEYVASESSFYRVLRAAGEQQRRGRARAPRKRSSPPRHRADGPRQLWSWDITWLAGPARGVFFYLYLIVDLYSRKIVGAEVYERESAEHASALMQRAALAERCVDRPLVLHADNGSPMKAATLRVTLEKLGVEPSYSRPGVSNDNAFSEAVFRTCKYRPHFPVDGFATLQAAREWVLGFVRWYNQTHRHSGIRFVTPHERHEGLDHGILAHRERVYETARQRTPERWSGKARNWSPIRRVWLNGPDAQKTEEENLEAA